MVGDSWKPLTPLNGPIYSYGRTDGGKTWKLIAVLQYYHSRGYKIWDLWGGKRKEGAFWCFPSEEHELWAKYEKETGEMASRGPKEYAVRMIYPFFADTIPNRLPSKKPRIESSLFTIYFKSVREDEISTVIGGFSNEARYIWETIVRELSDDANCYDILQWFETRDTEKYKGTTIYRGFIQPFCRSEVLQGKNCPYNIDLIEESSRDTRDVVTILMDDYTPEKFKMFFILYIYKNLYELGEADKIHRKHIAYLRELNYFMKVQDASAKEFEQKQIMREAISELIRYGRTVIIGAGDTQSPTEVRGLVEGQEDLLLINALPGRKDREVACDRLVSDGRMSSHQRDYLGSVEFTIEKMVVVERGKFARLVKRVQPPRTRCYKREDGNFLKVWKGSYNEWDEAPKIVRSELKKLTKERRGRIVPVLLKRKEISREEEETPITQITELNERNYV